MKKQQMYVVALAAMTTMGWACSNEDVQPGQSGELRIASVGIENTADSRSAAVNKLTTFEEGASLRMWVRPVEGTYYDGKAYDNLKLTKVGEGWTLSEKVKLNETIANVYALYPYMTNVAISSCSIPSDDTDYLYGTAEGVSITSPNVRLQMKHLRCALVLQVKADGYTGTGTVTGELKPDNGCYTEGTFNLTTGEWTSKLTQTITLTEGSIAKNNVLTTEVFLLPGESVGATATIYVDGHKYQCTFMDGKKLQAGHVYTYTLTVSDVNIGVASGAVKVDSWETEKAESEIKLEY